MKTETSLQKIMRKTGRHLVQCDCKLCQRQCQQTPCLGTPEDILKLIEAGYGENIKPTDWSAGQVMGVTKEIIPMYQLLMTPTGCIFFESGHCKIHHTGLKPTEGKLSHHSHKVDNYVPKKSLAWNVVKEWLDPANAGTIRNIEELLNIPYNERI